MFDDNNNNNNKDNNNFVHKYFKVESIPRKGLGLVSTRDIAGKILIKGFQSDIFNTYQFPFSCLREDVQREVLSLSNVFTTKSDKLMDQLLGRVSVTTFLSHSF